MRVRHGGVDLAALSLPDPGEVARADHDLAREALCLLALSRSAVPPGRDGALGEASPDAAMRDEHIAGLLPSLADEERDARALAALDDAARRALSPRLCRVREMATVVSALLSMRSEAASVERSERRAR
jgi:hypothetical protein